MANKFHPGNHEAEICYREEADVQKHAINLCANCLSRYHDDDLIEIARTEFYPITKAPNPCYEKGTCHCTKCRVYPTPSNARVVLCILPTHGCPKHVFLGQGTHKHMRVGGHSINWSKYTCTRPGSSGASVFIPGYHFPCRSDSEENYKAQVCYEGEAEMCYGGEAEMCYGGEADLHKHVTHCKKNPGHKGFIPLSDFNINCLPLHYQDDDLLQSITTLAALTVMVKVKYTSLERPERSSYCFIDQYPFYNIRGAFMLRIATGRVADVSIETGVRSCECPKCLFSDTPSKRWGVIKVVTATHVVFDDSEARQTRCVLGFDDNKSPAVCLDGLKVVEADIESDLCVLRYVTCDLELLDELDEMCQRFKNLCLAVKRKYERFVDVDKLTIIVSHPHGCPKQVSLGHWTHKLERDNRDRYWYTTGTCPGSSGATVYKVGYAEVLPFHSHSGTNAEGNFSNEWLCHPTVSQIDKNVVTGTHVVYDDSEVRQTRCVLGFDDNKSPVDSLDGWECW